MNLFKNKTSAVKKDKRGSVTVIIAAAGSGTRLGGVSKPLLKLLGKYAVEYSIEAFSACESVTRIVISAKEDDIPVYERLIAEKGYGKVVGVISGGSTRQESVSKAFRYAFSETITDFVAIHDAARPLITTDEINKAISDAKKYGSAVCASVCPDTVKRACKSGFASEDVDRENLYLIKTPQIFSFDIFAASLALSEKNGLCATDDSSLVLDAGFKVKFTECSTQNLKITYPGDAQLCELILRSRMTSKTEE